MLKIKSASTAFPLIFFMTDSTDHLTGKAGLSPTVTLSKNGGSFGSPAGAVSEIANGWYKVAGNATDSATVGPLILHASATGADPTDMVFEVVAYDGQDSVRMGLTALPNAVPGAANGLPTTNGTKVNQTVDLTAGQTIAATIAAGAIATDAITAAAVKADAVTKIQNGLATPTNITAGVITTVTNLTNAPTAGDLTATMKTSVTTAATAATPALSSAGVTAVAAGVWNALTSGMSTVGSIGKKLADWVVGTIDTYTGNTKQTGDAYARLGAPAGASVSADVAAVNAKTTNLPASPAAVGSQMDLVNAPNATALTAIAAAIWAALTSGMSTAGSIGKKLADWVVGTINTYTGNTKQTADISTKIPTALSFTGANVNAESNVTAAHTDMATATSQTSILSKLLKYVQLIVRKDAAIATDNATEKTAINANGGSGAGAFDNTTDAVEAIRDRGDAAWITGSPTGLTAQETADAVNNLAPASTAAAGSIRAKLDAKKFSDGVVHLSSDGTETTAVYPAGEATAPVADNKFDIAIDIAKANKLNEIVIDHNDGTSIQDGDTDNAYDLMKIRGIAPSIMTGDIGAFYPCFALMQDSQGVVFENLQLNNQNGPFTGQVKFGNFIHCQLGGDLYDIGGYFENCVISGKILEHHTLGDWKHLTIRDSRFSMSPEETVWNNSGLDLRYVASIAEDPWYCRIDKCFGRLWIYGLNDADAIIIIDGFEGEIVMEADCVAGKVFIRGGAGKITNTSTLTVTNDGFNQNSSAAPTVAQIADGVWDEVITGHNNASSTGRTLKQSRESII